MAVDVDRSPVEILAGAVVRASSATDLRVGAAELARAAAEATRADVAVLHLRGEDGMLVARALAPEGAGLAAELAGTRMPADEVVAGRPSAVVARAAERAGAGPGEILTVPAEAGGRVVGLVELLRAGDPFGDEERAIAVFAAAQLALLHRLLTPDLTEAPGQRRARVLELAGDALAAAGDVRSASIHALRAAVEASRARGGAIWRLHGGRPEAVAVEGDVDTTSEAAALAVAAAAARGPAVVELGADGRCAATLPLGEPVFAVLHLDYDEGAAPDEVELNALARFASRTAHALRSGEHAAQLEHDLSRTRALLDVVGEATSRLSLAHTLETGVERVSQLLGLEEVGVYLMEDGELRPAAGRGLPPGHQRVARAFQETIEGPLRARAAVQASELGTERTLAGVRAALAAAGRPRAAAVPLRVRGESSGLLVAYPSEQPLSGNDVALLAALSAQLAVAAQNARLHEQATDLGDALGAALRSERQASRQVAALYEISRSFTQTLSLDATLRAVAETLVRELEIDAAVIRVPDERGDVFVPRGVHVADVRLADAVRAILDHPQRRPRRSSEPRLLAARSLERLGGAHALLRPFLEKGSTAALVPIATPTELLAELTIVSLDPAAPIDADTLATAATIAGQAALAIDNARLYHQQKEFAEAMQRSLLPSEQPSLPGIEIGKVYESAAQVDVGGDVYDFLELADGRLAVVLGDVTGHGIAATADMAMAKFVFRSLAREHPQPGDFLAHANDVVVDEIALGKFITMTYVTVDLDGRLVGASAGHPPPRLLLPDGRVEVLECGGLALGIDAPQHYDEVIAQLPRGAAVVLYTDGVVESRIGTELFGVARLDEALASSAGRPAQEIADAVLAASRAFARDALPDDCAVVVIRRTA